MLVPVFFLFLSFAEKEYQTESKLNETFVMFFPGPEDNQETWTLLQEVSREDTRVEGGPPASWAPRSSTDVLLPPIYTYVPPLDQRGEPKT